MRRVYVLGVVGLGEELFDIRRRSVLLEHKLRILDKPLDKPCLSRNDVGRLRADKHDQKVIHTNEGKPTSYFCHANLVDFAAPIMLGDRMIGSFIGGQVLAEEPD